MSMGFTIGRLMVTSCGLQVAGYGLQVGRPQEGWEYWIVGAGAGWRLTAVGERQLLPYRVPNRHSGFSNQR
jgi:hypothetical protein